MFLAVADVLIYRDVISPFINTKINICDISVQSCVMLCCEECPATDVHSVLRCVILTTQHGMLPQHPTCTTKLICDYF